MWSTRRTVADVISEISRHDTQEERTRVVNQALRPVDRVRPDKNDMSWNTSLIVALRDQKLWP
jgi:hypothetical protein